MKRRVLLIVFVASLGASIAPSSFAQRPQRVIRIGFLRYSDPSTGNRYLESFRQGLRDLGYVEGRDFALEPRFASGRVENFPDLVADLVRSNVDVVVTTDTPATRAFQQANTETPVVMANVIDPVGSGFVESLGRPGGNITGLSSMTGDLSAKHIQLLRATIPNLSLIGVLLNPVNSGHRTILMNLRAAAEKHAMKVVGFEAADVQKMEQAFAVMRSTRVGAVIVVADAFFTQRRDQIAELAIRYRLPSISANREYVEAGALMSYGQNFQHNVRRAAVYVDRIARGAKAADLPVELPTRFELALNRKTADLLGLMIPGELLVSADEIIQ